MAIKKSELYASLWASCDELRGGMDASQYKDYVLFMLFIKYVSDKYADYAGFEPPVTIPRGAGFKDMLALRGKSDIGDRINTQIIQPLIDANDRLRRTDFPDFNDPNKLGEGKAMVDRLTNLINIFGDSKLDFSQNRADHDDILGDAYEYLMRHFAQDSGKSKGQFYTPSEVSRTIAQVIGISKADANARTTAYDPTCGSGSLLLKLAAEAGERITLEGQEMDVTTAGLARMNMILHDFPTANIQQGNTLAAPKFKDGEYLRTYDFVVANPPFSDKTWSIGLSPEDDEYQRFAWGVPPNKQGDYAYLLHIIRSMKSSGKAACILPHGVLFRGNAEAVIREALVRSGILKGIIGLPANLFYGTGIPACILLLDKENAQARRGIFMIDAAKGFIKDGNKNRLREQDIHKIVDVFNRQDESNPRYARMVPFDEIASDKNAYNLNLPRYIDSSDPEDLQDIDAHLRGGIPERDIQGDDSELTSYWQVLPGVREALFDTSHFQAQGRSGYSHLKHPLNEVRTVILEHAEFTAFKTQVMDIFNHWYCAQLPELEGFERGAHPKALITSISEALLASFRQAPLLDAYDVYQHLMDYWAETLQDDAYQIAADGWVAETYRVKETVKSGKKKGQIKDKGWACDLLPKPYIVARYFVDEQIELERLQVQVDATEAELVELKEEHSGEDGALRDVSSKADVQVAYQEALVALWNEQDKAAYERYRCLIEQAEAEAQSLRELTDHAYLSRLKSKKGMLSLTAVKGRLKADIDLVEQAMLERYLAADKAQKSCGKKAKVLLSQAEATLLRQLKQKTRPESFTELYAVTRYQQLLKQQTELKAQFKGADAELDQLVYDKYPQLTPEQVRTLLIGDKWRPALAADIRKELECVSQRLTGRIRQLAQRYETPLPTLVEDVAELSARVDAHLKQMGAVWN